MSGDGVTDVEQDASGSAKEWGLGSSFFIRVQKTVFALTLHLVLSLGPNESILLSLQDFIVGDSDAEPERRVWLQTMCFLKNHCL